MTTRAIIIKLLWAASGIGLLIVLAILSGSTMNGLVTAVLSVPVWVHFSVVLAQTSIIALAAVKWRLILTTTAEDNAALPLPDAVAATALGALAGQVLPIQLVTPGIRAWYARRHNISARRAIGTSIFEQIFEVIVLLSMATVGLAVAVLATNIGFSIALAALFMVVMTLLMLPVLRLLATVFRFVAATVKGRVKTAFSALSMATHHVADFPHNILFWLTGLSFLRYVLLAGLNVLILAMLAPDVGSLQILLAYPLVLLILSLPVFPGGLGVLEATWVGVLVANGIASGEAVEIALALRIVLIFGFLLVMPILIALPRLRT